MGGERADGQFVILVVKLVYGKTSAFSHGYCTRQDGLVQYHWLLADILLYTNFKNKDN